jgi:hypothetical protein
MRRANGWRLSRLVQQSGGAINSNAAIDVYVAAERKPASHRLAERNLDHAGEWGKSHGTGRGTQRCVASPGGQYRADRRSSAIARSGGTDSAADIAASDTFR